MTFDSDLSLPTVKTFIRDLTAVFDSMLCRGIVSGKHRSKIVFLKRPRQLIGTVLNHKIVSEMQELFLIALLYWSDLTF